jgi:hypothetical protein
MATDLTMNDYWNDPPEYTEVPECCDLEMIVDDQGNCQCSECGKRIEHERDIEPVFTEEELMEFFDQSQT